MQKNIKIRVTENREKVIELVNAYFDNKKIEVRDPESGIKEWTSIDNPYFWTYLERLCKNIDKYKIR